VESVLDCRIIVDYDENCPMMLEKITRYTPRRPVEKSVGRRKNLWKLWKNQKINPHDRDTK
jgi:hypothetical protein